MDTFNKTLSLREPVVVQMLHFSLILSEYCAILSVFILTSTSSALSSKSAKAKLLLEQLKALRGEVILRIF